MNNFKKIFFCLSMLCCQNLKSENPLEVLDQKIKNLEMLICSLVQNMSLQQDLIKLLQKQLQINLEVEDEGDDAAENHSTEEDHHLLLRMPKWLLTKIDAKRKKRVGKISRNLWILEVIDEATKK